MFIVNSLTCTNKRKPCTYFMASHLNCNYTIPYGIPILMHPLYFASNLNLNQAMFVFFFPGQVTNIHLSYKRPDFVHNPRHLSSVALFVGRDLISKILSLHFKDKKK